MANQVSNHFKFLLATGVIDLSADSFKIILMESGFIFSKDNHAQYADVLASELATGNGYTQGTKVLAGVVVTEDDIDDRCEVVWSNPSWTAGGGPIGPSPGAIIYDDTVPNDPIVGYIDFGAEYTQVDGGTFTVAGVELRVS